MNGGMGVLLSHLIATVFMVGVIWTVQIVHYPLFGLVGERFIDYQAAHSTRVSTLIALPWAVQGLTGLALVARRPAGVPLWSVLADLALLGVAVAVTVLISARSTPCSATASTPTRTGCWSPPTGSAPRRGLAAVRWPSCRRWLPSAAGESYAVAPGFAGGGYHWCMSHGTQLAARFDAGAVKELDELIRAGRFGSRAEAVRAAVHAYLDAERRRGVGEAILEGYRRLPETDDEMAAAEANLRQLIAEEPW